jgi:hypothetical protein
MRLRRNRLSVDAPAHSPYRLVIYDLAGRAVFDRTARTGGRMRCALTPYGAGVYVAAVTYGRGGIMQSLTVTK